MMRRAFPFLLPVLAASVAAGATDARSGAPRGLWVGPIHVCRDNARVETRTDPGMGPSAIITLDAAGGARLARETGAHVRDRLPVRVDGRVIIAPQVMEPITGGMLEIHSGTAADIAAVERAARRRC